MRRISLYICWVVYMLCLSCSKDEAYSCDPEINKWVIGNLETIQAMTRSDWVKIDDVLYQRGAYAAFSEDQRSMLWLDKFNAILGYDWNMDEYEHIRSLRDMIQNNIIWFQQDCSEEDLDNKDLFMYKWMDYAVTRLNWSNELIYAIAFTPESLSADKTLIKSKRVNHSKLLTRTEDETTELLCDCHNPESAHYFQCGSDKYDCVTGSCKTTSWKCGWLWTNECNGLCYVK